MQMLRGRTSNLECALAVSIYSVASTPGNLQEFCDEYPDFEIFLTVAGSVLRSYNGSKTGTL